MKLSKRKREDLLWAFLGRLAARQGIGIEAAFALATAAREKKPTKTRRIIFRRNYDLIMTGKIAGGNNERQSTS